MVVTKVGLNLIWEEQQEKAVVFAFLVAGAPEIKKEDKNKGNGNQDQATQQARN